MSSVTANYSAQSHSATVARSASEKVITILKLTYGLVPIVAGADKFTHILVNWDKYLAPVVTNMLPFSAHTFMLIVGVVEIVAGLIVLIKPKIGSIIVSLWLLGIAINLLLTGQYYDIAVRDTVMAIGSFSLFTLINGRE